MKRIGEKTQSNSHPYKDARGPLRLYKSIGFEQNGWYGLLFGKRD